MIYQTRTSFFFPFFKPRGGGGSKAKYIANTMFVIPVGHTHKNITLPD
jgi:hypothetical protein